MSREHLVEADTAAQHLASRGLQFHRLHAKMQSLYGQLCGLTTSSVEADNTVPLFERDVNGVGDAMRIFYRVASSGS